jgi:hypothetical protein
MADSASVELRGQASRDLVDMLDAISQHRRITRWQLIEEILGAWREDMERQTVIVARVTGVLGDRRDR